MKQSTTTSWYVRDRIAGQPRQIWSFDGQTALNEGVSNARNGPGTHFEAKPGQGFVDCLREQTPWIVDRSPEGQFHLMKLGPGEIFPRIARPIALAISDELWSPWPETDPDYVAESRSQLVVLARKLASICQTVQPTPATLDVFGHEIRNLLILAATEMEMHCRGVLRKNSYPASAALNGNAYVRLADPMKLRDFRVTFRDYPSLPPVEPFRGWLQDDPSKSLPWYDAYNGVKHNREDEFDRGTLRHAFSAVSACIVLFVAQFGPAALVAELSTFVRMEMPHWSIDDMYLPRPESGWRFISCPALTGIATKKRQASPRKAA